ncbi:WD40 repeat-like protein [Favolaschia claudopus]|uniref:WD40 repeat-like protein n=1 Tax=Favolaschia claudopus TaxID=2862362 RepID=A0AAW0BEY8_9AGAR
MKIENLRLRIRLDDIETLLFELQTPSTSQNRVNTRQGTRLKQERCRRLREEKVIVKQSLNRIIYPILTVPVEITSEIFLQCLPDRLTEPRAYSAPFLLGQICSVWRQIALNNPRLWAALHVRYSGNGRHFQNLIQNWLPRAGSVPFSLSLTLPPKHCYFFSPRMCYCPSSAPFVDYWSRLTCFNGIYFTLQECIDLLSRAPNLTVGKFSYLDGFLSSTKTATCVIQLDNIKDLYFHTVYSTPGPSSLLESLSAPCLQSLSIHCLSGHITDKPFFSFLRKSPCIHTFDLTLEYISQEADIALLKAMPALEVFQLNFSCSTAIVFAILSLLDDDESATFLPRIRKLAFGNFNPRFRFTWEDSFTKILFNALNSRCDSAKSGTAQLGSFEFHCSITNPQDAKLNDCLTKLKAKGIRVFVA